MEWIAPPQGSQFPRPTGTRPNPEVGNRTRAQSRVWNKYVIYIVNENPPRAQSRVLNKQMPREQPRSINRTVAKLESFLAYDKSMSSTNALSISMFGVLHAIMPCKKLVASSVKQFHKKWSRGIESISNIICICRPDESWDLSFPSGTWHQN